MHYTDGIFYELSLTAKYIKKLGLNYFDEIKAELTPEEFIALDVTDANPGICQRDLAKLILKDRAGTGRIITSLEEKGYLKRYADTNNNRLIRAIKLTEKGRTTRQSMLNRLIPSIQLIEENFNTEEQSELRRLLTKLRNVLKKTVKTKI